MPSETFISAEASAAALPVSATDPASAANSRYRESARVPRLAIPADRHRDRGAGHHEPADVDQVAAAAQQCGAGAADDGHHRGVAVGDVGELMADHGLQLVRLEAIEQPAC